MRRSHAIGDTIEGVETVLVRVPLLSRILFRKTAKKIGVGGEQLALFYPRGFVELPRGDVVGISAIRGMLWDSLRIVTHKEQRVLRGLSHGSATLVADTWVVLGLLSRMHAALDAFRHLLCRDSYLNRAAVAAWCATHGSLLDGLPADTDPLPLSDDVKGVIREYRRYSAQHERISDERNGAFVARKMREHAAWFARAGGDYGLTDEQQEAILHDEDNCIVVAGAGTGKTSTVAGKCGYLVHTGAATADRILLLAFTRKAAEEMGKRLEMVTSSSFHARTFHALGLEILAEVEGRRPAVSRLAEDDQAFKRAITSYLNVLLDAPESRDALIEFFAYFRYPYRSPFEFATPDEYLRAVRAYDLRTLQGERVKSHEEVLIADWLFLNGIRYVYEGEYEHDTASVQYRQYKPDFYLPDVGVYLEHFGVDRTGETAPHIDSVRYRAQMEWKRQTHRKFGTTLLETYSWQRMEHRLHEALDEHMRTHGASLRPRPPEEVVRLIREHGFVEPVASLLGTFLSLYKSNAWSAAEVRAAATAAGQTRDELRDRAFLRVFHLVYERYEAQLRAAREVDFNDMIASAAAHVEGNRYRSQFTHIIVDECQDFSRGRARLLRALLTQVPDRRLFCVGDDWQSIYRFNGSDVAQMTHFADEFGFTKRCDLTRTHRFSQELLEATSRFVQQNPAQLRKHLSASRHLNRPAIVLRAVPSHGKREQEPVWLRAVISDIVRERPDASVLVMGRYNHTLPEEVHRAAFERRHPSVNFRWLTVHRAKGLEADYAVLLDVASAKFGFPAEIADDPILDLVLAAAGGYANAEERRLFYVGLTRARELTYVLAPESSPSKFVDELSGAAYHAWVEAAVAGQAGMPRCPECSGRLVRREGEHGSFWGCANFPLCEGKARECPSCHMGALVSGSAGFVCSKPACAKMLPRCPHCNVGALLRRNGRYGDFYACSEGRPEGAGVSCTYKRSARRRR